MKIENSFEIEAPPEHAWDLLMDVPRVIPCMPGAALTETVDESRWKATVSVKLGPVALTFATDVTRDEADEATRRATLSARARETRGRGGGQATIESTLVPVDGRTRVDLVTNLALSGPVAQYGRGMVADVASQLVSRFADCLRAELTAAPGGVETAPRPPVEPVSGLALAFAALGRALKRSVSRLTGRKPDSRPNERSEQ